MKKLLLFVLAVAGYAAADGHTNISVTTDHTQLVLQVKDNGRLYQTYLGERLSADSNLDDLDQPWAKPTNSNIAGFEAYPVMGTEDYYDAAMGIRHADGNYFRNQLVLDMTNPEVQDFVFGVVDNLMQENPNLKFFKWDCNSPITNIYSHYEKQNQGNLYIDYVRGFYKTLERIQQKYPDLNMMMCSSGGGRCDFGALKYYTEFWCSDNTDPVERLFIQWGFSHFMPAKVMCAHVTNMNRRASVKFRTDVAFMCKLGFDIGLHDMAPADKAFCQNALKEYNRLKQLVFSPMTYRLVSPYDGNHCVIQRVSEDKSHAIVAAYDIHPRVGENLHPTRLQGLDADARYLVKEICLMPDARSGMYFHDRVYTGDYLMKVGLKVLTGGELSSRIIELVKE